MQSETHTQRFYLQFILKHLREHARWPTHRQLDQIFLEAYPERDIEDVWKSLPPGLTSHLDIYQLDQSATLTIPGIYTLEPDAPELLLFLQTLQLGVTAHLSQRSSPQMSNETLLQDHPQWSLEDVHRAGLLLLGEPFIWQSFSGPGPSGEWNCSFAREIRRFRNVKTIEEYLAKRNPSRPQPSIPSAEDTSTLIVLEPDNTSAYISVPVQEVSLHPNIHARCWQPYSTGDYDGAILNATKAIEVAVREKSKVSEDIVGANLIAKAFRTDDPLLIYSPVKAEQEGMMALLRGIIMVYKNPQSHRFVGIQNASACFGILLLCSSLLDTIDTLKVKEPAETLPD